MSVIYTIGRSIDEIDVLQKFMGSKNKINMVNILHVILVSTFIFSSQVFAQKNRIKFENLNIDDGLSQSIVTKILEDKYGFMWFGTQDGLNRFDGYSFKIYRNDRNDSTTISGNYIRSLLKDHSGNIWMGDLFGNLNKYDYSTDSFMSSKLDSNYNNNVINVITEDRNGTFYIGTRYGLYSYNPVSRKYEHFQIDPLGDRDNAIYSLKFDKNNNLWVGTVFKGLFWFNKELKIFERPAAHARFQELTNTGLIRDIYEDSNENIWIATWGNGAIQYNPSDKLMRQYTHSEDTEKSLSSTLVSSIVEDKNGKFWIGTYNGFNLLDMNTGVIDNFFSDIEDKNNLADNIVQNLYKDTLGNLWIGTNDGLSKIEKHYKQFYNLRSDQTETDLELRRSIWSIASDEENNIWLGNTNGALIRVGSDGSSEIKYIANLINPGDDRRSTEGQFRRILFHTDGTQWLGTNGLGLIAVDKKSGKYRTYTNDPENENSLSTNNITTLFEDSKGNLWVGTSNRGLNRFIRSENNFQRYKPEPGNESSLSSQGIADIVEDSNGFIWIGTLYGLNRYDMNSKSFTRYLNDNSGLISDRIVSLYHDRDNHLWIGTDIGLNMLDLKTFEFRSYTMKDGLASDFINTIRSDGKGNIWVSTNYGISKIDPITRAITNYDALDGLQSTEFNMGSALMSRDGKIYFGGVNGITHFHPDSIKMNPNIPNIAITSFKIFERGYPLGNRSEIQLSYEDNYISFEFAALDFTNPEKNQFAYKLEGVDPDWIYSGNRHFAYYRNLSPGNYSLTIKGSNNDGVWNEVGTSLKIIIIPPWWQTTWFKVIIWLSVFIAVISLHRLRIWRINSQKLQLEKLVLEKTKELKSKQEKAEFTKITIEKQSKEILALDKLKSRFFANISHEFRTPLTLIMGPLEEMLERSSSFKMKRTIQIMLRNARRLLRLIVQMLDLSKIETGHFDLKPSPGDVTGFVRNIVVSFSALAEVRNIQLEFDGDESIYAYFDKNSFEKVLLNLIYNAFKFTPDYGDIFIHLEIRKENSKSKQTENIFISIKDTGSGIKEEKLLHIFERFYQANESDIWNSEGSGIGLSLSKELVELHNGEIGVKSILDEGSEFWFSIPLVPVEEEKIKQIENEEFVEEDIDSVQLYEILEREKLIEENNSDLFPNSGDIEKPILLIVEDNADLRNYLVENLSQMYKIIVSSDGKEGMENAFKSIPDLIISDVMMPNVDGFELCATLKQDDRTSHIPIILLTARSEDKDKFRGLEYGADEYLLKPFNLKELKIRMKNLIQQRERIRLQYSKDSALAVGSISENSVDRIFLDKARSVVENNMSYPNFGVKELAEKLSMSRKQLHRKLRALIDITPSKYIRTIRLNRAKKLLIQKTGNITEIAYKVGFSSSSYFTKCYKEEFDTVPSDLEN